ncbi:hypothetical protein GRO01_20440 [Gluconobacter roseus NBRC 3990]|uniref:Uncharacterized protein n=1 Tax=Gluconobacter roseus NBRC 3990 TaxID=1307950 RepID=A0A4Y3MAS0_9PROT|nr:hypothetical protein AA3990_1862 [Gluconobacter roseus NBRC 3990]GEB04468.1 hypothetical protein GRO01_20440 [Gluconobacter roseus NBRC 3990]GLP92394.1 hypothetical protein GCM10007871_03720 [Gluconobacter roseus NBRC 3990]
MYDCIVSYMLPVSGHEKAACPASFQDPIGYKTIIGIGDSKGTDTALSGEVADGR